MCNCILWVRRRLLALLLIIGCMAVSATASATVCFLPDAEGCGLGSATDGNNICDGVTAYESPNDCNKSITLHHDSQYCEQDGACYRRYCKYTSQSACEASAKEYTGKNDHFFCVYDSSTGCYDLQDTPCMEKTTKSNCDAKYTLDAPREGETCGSCKQRVVTETCSDDGIPGETDEYKTVYDCVPTKYQQVGCDDFDKTETEKKALEAAPNNYHCTSCTKTKQKQDYEGHWNDYGTGDTVYKCKPTCATYGLVTSCSQGSDEAGTIEFTVDSQGRTDYDGTTKCGTCGCTPTPCTGYDYTEDTLSDKANTSTCDPGCGQGTRYQCKDGYVYNETTKSCKVKDQNDGKIYYVTVDANITPQLNKDKDGSDSAAHYVYEFVFSGKFTLPDVSNDTFFTENEIGFAAELKATANVSCSSTEEHDLRVYTQPAYPKMGKEQTVSAYDLANTEGTTKNTFTSSNANCTMQKYELDKTGSKYWFGFATGQALSTDDNLFSNCKTISKNGSSRTICIKYTDVQDKTCEQWVAENFPDFSIVKSGSSVSGSRKTLLLSDIDTSETINLTGTLVGPKYFNYGKCQALDTPTISITNKYGDGIELGGGTLAGVNVEYDNVAYKEFGGNDEVCNNYDFCFGSTGYSADMFCNSIVEIINRSGDETVVSSLCSTYGYSELCGILNDNGCKGDSTYTGKPYINCENSSYGTCSSDSVATELCHSDYIEEKCYSNYHSAISGYGTVKDVIINSKKKDMQAVVYPSGGTMTIEGTVKIFGAANTTPLRIGDPASSYFGISRTRASVVVNGTLDVKSGRGIYYTRNGKITVNKGGTMKLSYGDWQGIFFNYASDLMDVYGTLDISSYHSGGQYENDFEGYNNQGGTTINNHSGSCIKLENGASGTVTFKYESGVNLKMKGSCKKATTSGEIKSGNQAKPNELHGTFTSHPSGFTASCDSSCN